MAGAKGFFPMPLAVCGYFNTIRFPLKKKNCNRTNKPMTEFSEFVEDMELVDHHLSGGTFTWRKGDRHGIAAR